MTSSSQSSRDMIQPFLKRAAYFLLIFVSVFLIVLGVRAWHSGTSLKTLFEKKEQTSVQITSKNFTPAINSPLNLADVEILSRLNEEYARLTNAVVPSVVSINTSSIRAERMLDYFGRQRVRRFPTTGQGSGVIVSEQGHIITNHHVISGQQEILVTLHTGKTYGARLIGEDRLLDIAVIKIDSEEKFVPLKLGNSSETKVGQVVFAVGNPFGLGETVTQGIISASERSVSDNQRDLLQTDTAINPGNSGGPLVNLIGEVIGINVSIFPLDEANPSFSGVGFSIPSNAVKTALEKILRGGASVSGYLGVRMLDLSPAVRADLSYDGELGCAVYIVSEGSPAEKAGLLPKDVVIEYGGQEITSVGQLISYVQNSDIGRTVPIKIWRNKRQLTLYAKVEVSEARNKQEAIPSTPESLLKNAKVLETIGLHIRDLTAEESEKGFRGVVVSKILSGSLSGNRLERNDLIIAINRQPATRANDFYLRLAASATVGETLLHVFRKGQPLTVKIPQPDLSE